MQVKIIQGSKDTLYGPVKSSSTATEFQVSPASLTDKIRYLEATHGSSTSSLVFVHCVLALNTAKLISRDKLSGKSHSSGNPAPQHVKAIKLYSSLTSYRVNFRSQIQAVQRLMASIKRKDFTVYLEKFRVKGKVCSSRIKPQCILRTKLIVDYKIYSCHVKRYLEIDASKFAKEKPSRKTHSR